MKFVILIVKRNDSCKLFVIRTDEGVVKVKRLNNNARIPVKGTPEAAGYDLAAAQTAVCPAHGKVLVKTGLSLAMPSGCYGRIAPRSGLALKKFIDVGAGVVDADYRGELGIVLFNFSDTDFQINMGDKVAQLIFEKIKTPVLKEVDSLEDTDRGNKGFGSTGIKTTSESESVQSVTKISDNQAVQDARISKILMNEPIPHIKKRSQTAKARRIMSARQMQKLIKNDEPVFLAVVRASDSFVPRGSRNKRSPSYAAVNSAHGMTEGQRRKINKESGPKKNIISVKEREQEVLNSVPAVYRESLEKVIQKYRDVFPEKLPKGTPPIGRCNTGSKLNKVATLHIGHHTDWVLLSRTS